MTSTMTTTRKDWQRYTIVIIESMIAFYIATFCLIIYFYNYGSKDIFLSVVIGLLYLFVLFVSVQRLIVKLPLAVLMILVPIAPLYALIVVVTMIPILQLLQ